MRFCAEQNSQHHLLYYQKIILMRNNPKPSCNTLRSFCFSGVLCFKIIRGTRLKDEIKKEYSFLCWPEFNPRVMRKNIGLSVINCTNEYGIIKETRDRSNSVADF